MFSSFPSRWRAFPADGAPATMKLSRPLNRNIARLLMALALFVQWVVPASAYTMAPAKTAQVSAPMQMGMACHQGSADRSTCLTHCSQSDQASHDHLQLTAPHAPAPVWHVAVPPVSSLACAVSPRTEVKLASASPPLSILYCSLLN